MEYVANFTDPLTLFTSLNTSSSSQSFTESSGYTVVRKMQTIFVPIIFSFGLLGNLLALGCFLSQPLRTASCCLYMAAKCLSDTAFLAVLFIMWLYRVHVDLLNVQGVCQLTIFISYVSGFTSVWLVLAVTYENYIRICRPYVSKTYCTRRVALIVIGVIVVIAAIFYSFALWTNTVLGGEQGEHVVGERVGVGEELGKADSVEQEEEKEEAEEEAVKEEPPLCMAMVKFKDILMAMTFVDTVMTLVLPSLLIVPLVLMTLVAVARAFDRKNRLQDSLLSKRSPRDFKNSMEAKVARFLLAVSLTFMLLHTPGHLIRLKLLVGQYIQKIQDPCHSPCD